VAPDIGTDFGSWVDKKVAQALQPDVTNFAALVERLPGIYPAEVLASLKRQSSGTERIRAAAVALADSASLSAPGFATEERVTKFPPPHPLDYEWRFAKQAVSALAEACDACTDVEGSIALVGTPTIAACLKAVFGERTVSYFGMDTDAIRAVDSAWLTKLTNVNLLIRPPDVGTYATVIMDPPWYKEYMERFLWFAGQTTHIGGTLLLAMPPVGTRPGIVQENALLLSFCQQVGFERETVLAAKLPYEMPPFERNALRAENIRNVHPTWRKADLWQLRKTRPASLAWPGDIDSNPWWEQSFGLVRLRVDRNAPLQGLDPRLRSLIPGDILPTVSRRDPRREQARIWTTGNRIYGCDAPGLLCGLLEDLHNKRDTVRLSSDVKQEVLHQINAIVQKESRELA